MWRRRCPIGLLEEEDNQAAGQDGPEGGGREMLGERWAMAGPEGGGREVGRG
jgi:hypothetical protein